MVCRRLEMNLRKNLDTTFASRYISKMNDPGSGPQVHELSSNVQRILECSYRLPLVSVDADTSKSGQIHQQRVDGADECEAVHGTSQLTVLRIICI